MNLLKSATVKLTHDVWYVYESLCAYRNWLIENKEYIEFTSEKWYVKMKILTEIGKVNYKIYELERDFLTLEFIGDLSKLTIYKTLHNSQELNHFDSMRIKTSPSETVAKY